MRINKYIALATNISRREADKLIINNKVEINGKKAVIGAEVDQTDHVYLSGKKILLKKFTTIALNKPRGYVCSRRGQGSKTLYDLLPKQLNHLKPVGRLDKDSSGLILLTNNGDLAHKLSHPSNHKKKIYEIELNKSLSDDKKNMIERGILLEDGLSKLQLSGTGKNWAVTMQEGRNRQIRRTFSAVGCRVIKLHRRSFGDYKLNNIKEGEFIII